MKKGIDLSYAQPNVDWQTLAQQGLDFCYVKVCEGLHTLDALAAAHAAGAKNNGLQLGYYYFAHPARCNAKQSAQYFKNNLQGLPAPDLLFALDIEVNAEPGYTALSPGELLQWIHDFISELAQPIMIYGGPGFLDANLPAGHDLGQYPLWLAEYEGTPAPTVYPKGWATCSIWQDTGNGSIPGITEPVDLNISQQLPALPSV